MDVERNPTMFGGNRFKAAVFVSNCSSGRAAARCRALAEYLIFAVEHRDDGAIDTMINLYLSPANQRAMPRERRNNCVRAMARAMAGCWR